VHKFTFLVYSFLIRGLASELWFFEVHSEVHKFTGEILRLALLAQDFGSGLTPAKRLKFTPKRISSPR
jgi:hypothetical protein